MVVSSFEIEGGGGGRGSVVQIVVSIGISISSSSTGGALRSIARPTIAATLIAAMIGVVVLVRSINSSTISSSRIAGGVVHHRHRYRHDRSVRAAREGYPDHDWYGSILSTGSWRRCRGVRHNGVPLYL